MQEAPSGPGHNGLKKTGSCPQGASRSDKPGQVHPPPRRLVLCEQWQEAPKAHTEDQGNPLSHLEKPSLPLRSTVLGAAAPLTTVSDHPASCPYLRIKSKALPWEFPAAQWLGLALIAEGPGFNLMGELKLHKILHKAGKRYKHWAKRKRNISPILLKSRQSYTDYHLHVRNNFFLWMLGNLLFLTLK